jgi:regulator of RNase E activity RraB
MSEKDRDELKFERQKTRAVFSMSEKFGLGFRPKQCFDCFFYANTEDDANNLAIDLHKLGYEVDVHGDGVSRKHKWSIMGTTAEMDSDLNSVSAWSEEMHKLAKTHHAEFDGWGSEAS